MLTVVDIQTIVHLYRSGDYSRREIARKLGISRTTVDKVLAQYEATQETSDNEALDNLLTASAGLQQPWPQAPQAVTVHCGRDRQVS